MINEVKAHLKTVLNAAGCGERVFDDPEMDRLQAALPLAVFHHGPEKTAPVAGLLRVQNPNGSWTLYRKKFSRAVPLLIHIFARTQAEMETVTDAFLAGLQSRVADENGAPAVIIVGGVERNIPQNAVKGASMAEVSVAAEGFLCTKTVVGKISAMNIPAIGQQTIY